MSNKFIEWWRANSVPQEKRLDPENLFNFFPLATYPILMIFLEDIEGARRSIFEWYTGHAYISIFRWESVVLAVGFIAAFVSVYVLAFIGRSSRQVVLIVATSVLASVLYFSFVYLDARFAPDPKKFCAGKDGLPYCLSLFEHGLMMMLAIVLAKSICQELLRRLPHRDAETQ
jgi:hypothetical protein